MQASIHLVESLPKNIGKVFFLSKDFPLAQLFKETAYLDYVEQKIKERQPQISLYAKDCWMIFISELDESLDYKKKEMLRKRAFELSQFQKSEKLSQISIDGQGLTEEELISFCEGLMLTNYSFEKYKTKKQEFSLKDIYLKHASLNQNQVKELEQLVKGAYIARDLVNEPVSYLTADQLSLEIEKLGNESGFEVEVLNELKIRSLKMGGLLAVNQGSEMPPTFSILEYKPSNAKNQKPYLLIGKGVVYDTGGLSLKPTPNSMDLMKSDMAGAAAVVGAMYAIAANKLPVHVIGLIPATDNRPGGNAVAPGDVITMFDGTTVEVLNTDAEGRLILADALSYAKKYNPELVIDLATLTGAAARAIGREGIVMMGNAGEDYKSKLKESGHQVYERLVEFPLWDEYKVYMESDIADLKNIGGESAGAITAGIFLQHFVDYQWMHLDIAGSAYLTQKDNYRGKNGTGAGVRLLYHFIKNLTK